jgi:hypothetical protein
LLLNVEEMGDFRPILQILLSVLFAGFILYSCSDDTDDIVPTEVNVTERVNPVYFNEEIIPIFEQNCIFCHSEKHTLEHHYPVTPYLTASVAYDSLMSGGYVDTISPEKSILYLRVSGTLESRNSTPLSFPGFNQALKCPEQLPHLIPVPGIVQKQVDFIIGGHIGAE